MPRVRSLGSLGVIRIGVLLGILGAVLVVRLPGILGGLLQFLGLGACRGVVALGSRLVVGPVVTGRSGLCSGDGHSSPGCGYAGRGAGPGGGCSAAGVGAWGLLLLCQRGRRAHLRGSRGRWVGGMLGAGVMWEDGSSPGPLWVRECGEGAFLLPEVVGECRGNVLQRYLWGRGPYLRGPGGRWVSVVLGR